MRFTKHFWGANLVRLSAALLALSALPAPAFAEDTTLQSRGLVRSNDRVEIRSDLSAVVERVHYREGMSFAKGKELIAFDCSRLKAELNSARAAASSASLELKAKKSLRANGAAGSSEVRIAQAAVNRTLADAAAVRARMKYCTISAPFDGRVVALNTHVHEMPEVNTPLMVIINDTSLELELVVPSNWLRWLKIGQDFQFSVDETGQNYSAKVTRMGAEIDPVSQTIRIFGTLEGDTSDVLAGMSGSALFPASGS
ncbi:efflux RND transporter periplasmic adaptor subunit [Pseudahrensia aquimaris]|uniref:Efflux RND transporter periplasmic adaptor subunit n=1 Tax=Pseudahrensia aquimaris TaxID=744461 RepID=A0ABW3FC55_9HYPH